MAKDLETRMSHALKRADRDARREKRKADNNECDRCALTLCGIRTCVDCGKTYRRCGEHGGQDGADRSLASHRGLLHTRGGKP